MFISHQREVLMCGKWLLVARGCFGVFIGCVGVASAHSVSNRRTISSERILGVLRNLYEGLFFIYSFQDAPEIRFILPVAC